MRKYILAIAVVVLYLYFNDQEHTVASKSTDTNGSAVPIQKAALQKKSQPNPKDFVTFEADTSSLRSHAGNATSYTKALEMEWIIQGQSLRFGSTPIQVLPDKNKIDTIYYRQHAAAKLDTIICNIAQPKSYQFVYNSCCGGFNVVYKGTHRQTRGQVLMQLTQASESKKFIGTLGEAGINVGPQITDTLRVACRSAMSPNIYWVTLSEIKDCNKQDDCQFVMCYKNNGQESYDYQYEVQIEIDRFLYLPLDHKPLLLQYDPIEGVTTLQ